MTSETIRRRRPVEAIKHRTNTSADCELRVRKALMRLVKTGAPFTVENVCALAGAARHSSTTSAALTSPRRFSPHAMHPKPRRPCASS